MSLNPQDAQAIFNAIQTNQDTITKLRARITELETALRELASSGIVLLEETSNTQERRTAQKRFRHAIADGLTLLKGSEQ